MKRVKDTLRDINVRPVKERGQNFLIDPEVPSLIAQFGKPEGDAKIVEIGPGLGALTAELVKFGPLTVIEIEDKFCRELSQKFPEITILNHDVRFVDFNEIGENLVVFGNLPYSFSSDIVFHLVKNAPYIQKAVLLLQKEFVQRMGAKPGGREYGVLSVSVQIAADVRFGPIIPGASFHPPAGVDSMVVELSFRKKPKYDIPDEAWFKRVVKASFLQRRKKLVNSLRASGFFTGAQIDAALSSASIDPGRRAETLSIEEFVELSRRLRAA